MTDKKTQQITISSISQLHQMMGFSKPEHPLISLINHNDMPVMAMDSPISFITSFYIIMIKRNIKGKIKYGQKYYDFD